jgi:hypothetical protein
MSVIEAPLQAFQEFDSARSRVIVDRLLRELVKARLNCLEKGLQLHDAIVVFEAKVLQGISSGDLNALEFESHYSAVRESWDRWIEGIQSEADQDLEIPELEESSVAMKVSRLLDAAIARKQNRDRKQASLDASIARVPLPSEWTEPAFASSVHTQNAVDLRDYLASLPR